LLSAKGLKESFQLSLNILLECFNTSSGLLWKSKALEPSKSLLLPSSTYLFIFSLACFSLQHNFLFNPEIPKAVAKEFGLPERWRCPAILNFGKIIDGSGPGNPAHPKTFDQIEERVKFF
jgi:hypothetical protein